MLNQVGNIKKIALLPTNLNLVSIKKEKERIKTKMPFDSLSYFALISR